MVGVMDGGGHHTHRRVCSLSNTLHKHILRVGEGKGVVGVMDGGRHHANRRIRSLSNTLHKHILRLGEGKGVVGVMDGGGHHTPSPPRFHCERQGPSMWLHFCASKAPEF